MVHHQTTHFSDAFCAWEQWDHADFDYRYQHLEALKIVIEIKNKSLGKLIDFHLSHAAKMLIKHQLMGATGETNELYTTGRGVGLLIIENHPDTTENTVNTAFSVLICALIAGNTMLVCSDNAKVNALLDTVLEQASLPSNIIQITTFNTALALLENDIRSLSFIGNENLLQEYNLKLAKRNGAIVSLIYETNISKPALLHDPLLSLRFITERTKTINITAAGGNASLLALSDRM